jgi:membrane associated rhomboid family serine protease
MAELIRPFVVVAVVVAVMWAEEVVDLIPGTPFDSWGVRPRSGRGLLGIPLMPFLHDGFRHLFGNTLPFLVMGWAIASGSVARFARVAAIVGVSSGIGVWLFARGGTVHIGASGIVFGFLTYLLARGIIARKVTWILGGLVTLVVYGGILWGLLPTPGVSWTGHVFGAAGGVLAAWILHRRTPDTAL